MGRHGALATAPGILQDLDVDTMELFCRFFSVEELINNFQLLDLNARELTILKVVLLQEMARHIAEQSALRNAVRDRFQTVAQVLRPPAQSA